MRSLRDLPPLLLIVLLALACQDEQTTAPDGSEEEPGGTQFGFVVGRIDPALVPAPTGLGAVLSAGSNGLEVAAAKLGTDGSLESLATAEVAADLTYRIENVPVGSENLVITAASDGVEVGQVILHGPVDAEISVTAAPLNGETTVEVRVLMELVGMGLPLDALNTVEISLLVQLDPGVAQDVMVSPPDVEAIAEGLAANSEILDGVLANLGADLDGGARFAATGQAAAEFARSLDEGTDPAAAHDALADAVARVLEESGASADGLAMATAGAATGLMRAMENADPEARLDIAKASVELNLETRMDVLNSLPSAMDATRENALAGLEQARSAVEGAASLAEIQTALGQMSDEAPEDLLNMILSQLENVPPEVRDQIEQRLMEAFDRADLADDLGNATTPPDIIAAVEAFRQEVRAAVDELLNTVRQAGGEFDAESLADLFVALRGGPDIPVPES